MSSHKERKWVAIAYPTRSQIYDADSLRKSVQLYFAFGIGWGVGRSVGQGPKGHRLVMVDTPEMRVGKECVLKGSKTPCSYCGPTWKRPEVSRDAERKLAYEARDWLRDLNDDAAYWKLYPSNVAGAPGLDIRSRTLADWELVFKDLDEVTHTVEVGPELLALGYAIPYGVPDENGTPNLTKECWGRILHERGLC